MNQSFNINENGVLNHVLYSLNTAIPIISDRVVSRIIVKFSNAIGMLSDNCYYTSPMSLVQLLFPHSIGGDTDKIASEITLNFIDGLTPGRILSINHFPTTYLFPVRSFLNGNISKITYSASDIIRHTFSNKMPDKEKEALTNQYGVEIEDREAYLRKTNTIDNLVDGIFDLTKDTILTALNPVIFILTANDISYPRAAMIDAIITGTILLTKHLSSSNNAIKHYTDYIYQEISMICDSGTHDGGENI